MADAAILNLLQIETKTYTEAIGMVVLAAWSVINRCGKRSSGGTREPTSSRLYVRDSRSAFRKKVECFHTTGSKTFASHECANLLTDPHHMIRVRLRMILREGNTKGHQVSSTF